MFPRILGLASVFPDHWAPQAQLSRFQARVVDAVSSGEERDRTLALVDRVYSRSGILRRASVISDFTKLEPEAFNFFPPAWDLEPCPTTAQRMSLYEHHSVELAERAGRAVLGEARFPATAVTHLIVVSCTGFFAPGPDCVLRERLGLNSGVSRTIVGFQGCYAGLSALRLASEITKGNPDALVLLVCVELCSLHFQKRLEPDIIVANGLFADGAAGVLVGSDRFGDGLASLLASRSRHVPTEEEAMSWRFGDHGFVMRLSGAVPSCLEQSIPSFTSQLLDAAGVQEAAVSAWAVHPGGRRIVEVLGSTLRLPDEATQDSLASLADHGNLSSATIFSVLGRVFQRLESGEPCAALGFGPGLTLEGAILRRS